MSSVLPLAKVLCGPVNTRKYPFNVPGTANISYGHKLPSLQGGCRLANERTKEYQGGEESKDPEYERRIKLREFEQHANRRIRERRKKQRSLQGIEIYEQELEKRRVRLKDLMIEDESLDTKELIDRVKRENETKFIEKQNRNEQELREQESHRLALVAEKREQQYISNCDALRGKLSEKIIRERKNVNRVQMIEREKRKQEEREVETKRLDETFLLGEFDEEKRRRLNAVTKEDLVRQMNLKVRLANEEKEQLLIQERDDLEKIREENEKSEKTRLEGERKKRENWKKILEEQIGMNKKLSMERENEERNLDVRLQQMIFEETKFKKNNSSDSREDMLAHLNLVKKFREEETKKNLKFDAYVEEVAKKASNSRDIATRNFKEARQRLFQEVLLGRDEQIKTKLEKLQQEKRVLDEEKRLFNEQLKIMAEQIATEKKLHRDKATRYGRELKQQQKYVDAVKQRLVDEELRIYKKGEKQEEEYLELVDKLLTRVTAEPKCK